MENEKIYRKQDFYDTLQAMGIPFETVEHEPAVTVELADRFIEGKEGVRSKTMFLCDRKKRRFYLFVTDEFKRLDMKAVGEKIGEKGLRMGNDEGLWEKLRLEPGVVSIFGLLNNGEKDVKVYVDREITGEKTITFHPNENTATLFFSMEDMFRFLSEIGAAYEVIDL